MRRGTPPVWPAAVGSGLAAGLLAVAVAAADGADLVAAPSSRAGASATRPAGASLIHQPRAPTISPVGALAVHPWRIPTARQEEATCPEGDSDPAVRDFLARAEARYRRLDAMRARFQQTIRVPLLDRERSGHGRWYQKGSSRFKLDFEEPPADVIVSDGEHLWLYYPSTHPGQVIRTTVEASPTGQGMADLQGRIFAEARQGYRACDAGTGRIAGVAVRQVVLSPTGPSPYRRVRVWVGRDDLLVRRFEIVEENETERTITLLELEPGASVPDSVFRFRVPPGVEVFSG